MSKRFTLIIAGTLVAVTAFAAGLLINSWISTASAAPESKAAGVADWTGGAVAASAPGDAAVASSPTGDTGFFADEDSDPDSFPAQHSVLLTVLWSVALTVTVKLAELVVPGAVSVTLGATVS